MESLTIPPERLKIPPKFHPVKTVSLQDVHETFKKYYYIPDTNLIDVVLAVKINRLLEGVPLWIFLVGRSGTGKTTLLEHLEDSDTKVIHYLTSKTLVSGKKEIKEDFIQLIWGKVVLIYDLAKVMTVNPLEKAQIFAQFRDLYDGHLGGMYGTGKDVTYQGKPPEMLVGVTNAIYNEKIIHDKLGTRELLYKIALTEEEEEEMKKRALTLSKNNLELIAKRNCEKIIQNFISSRKHLKDLKIPPEIDGKCLEITKELRILRATAEIDRYTGELQSDAEYEVPTRSSRQLLQLYKALKHLDPNYSDEKFLEICKHIVESSADQVTLKVYRLLQNEAGVQLSTNQVARKLRLGWKTAYTRCNLLWNTGVINRHVVDNPEGGGKVKMWSMLLT